jgi:2-C-methyl-D-erythritol 4-phosphate cytidylyltransferase/2-C-methyl-D-erythritol 2,4-cyclodiphosphate synthase
MNVMYVTAIIAAGGRGQRFGAAEPKQLLAIGGRPMLERSVSAFLSHPSVNEVIVALPQELVDDPPVYLRSAEAFTPDGSGKPLRVVAGGARRQDSVANAFRAVAERSDVIVIHDAARPFASADLIARTIAAAAESGAAVAALPARDTVKQGRDQFVGATLPRETIFLAQTPQAFRRSVLADALELADDATDEAALAERAGHQVRLVTGEASNIKITTPEDLVLAEAIAQAGQQDAIARTSDRSAEAFARQAGPARTGRAGTGYDLHRLVEGRPLVIGGVTIPSGRGALGHSDADVVCHAITDAILGAASLGDIGGHFPDADPRWKNASSLDLVARAVAHVKEHGFEVGNVDVTVVLEQPKLRDHVDAMRAAVASALGIDVARVSIKGKTNEGIDAIGRGEAIAAHAIAVVRSR